MGVITLSINDETEAKLRRLAIAKFGKRKGNMSSVIVEAVDSLVEKEGSVIKGIDLLEKGIDMGGMITKKRAEWHKR